MAKTQTPFSIENFIALYKKSLAVRNLTVAARREIDEAIEDRDVVFLREMYDILIAEEEKEAELFDEYSKDQEKIMLDFTENKGKLAEKYLSKMENREKQEADKLLQVIK